MEDPVVPLAKNLYGHPLAGLLWDMQFEKVLLENGWEKSSELGVFYSLTEKKDYSCLYTWTIYCRLGGLGEVDDVLGVLGVDRVVPIVVRVLVSS